ncbi:MAG: hypothetical protein ACYC65_02445 [Candidatus Limnocylindrales bacterium]
MHRRLIAIAAILALVGLAAGCSPSPEPAEDTDSDQAVYQQTMSISKDYLALRYRTDLVLANAGDFADYDAWNTEMSAVIGDWNAMEQDAATLEALAGKMAEEKISLNLVPVAYAYDQQEISDIVDRAPMGKKIMTLANHFGVDAKHAQAILNQSQAQVSRDAYGSEGDVFAGLENDATRVKNGCKITGFVAGVVMTGGAAGLAASGALVQTTVVVVGADLALEITGDEARIALGDKNKVSEMVSTIRTVTEPAAGILTIAAMPGNLGKAIEKLGAVSFTADQFRSAVQDGKVLGISIVPNSEGGLQVKTAALSPEELPAWRQDTGAIASGESIAEVLGAEVATAATSAAPEAEVTEAPAAPSEAPASEAPASAEPPAAAGVISRSDFDAWSDEQSLVWEEDGGFLGGDITEKFGPPDLITTKNGYPAWVYYDLISQLNNTSESVLFTFYEEGGFVATTEWGDRDRVNALVDHL